MNHLRSPNCSWNLPVRGLIALFLTLVTAGCSKSATYTYIDVYVSIDRQTVTANQLYKVTTCELQVLGAESSATINLRCPENRVKYDIGTFQWTSGVPTGTLQFQVTIFDANLVPVGKGTSPSIAVSPGKHLATSVLVLGVASQPEADAGADASPPTDSGGDSGADTSASGDAMTWDGGADQSGTSDTGTGDRAADTLLDVGASDGGATDAGGTDVPTDSTASVPDADDAATGG